MVPANSNLVLGTRPAPCAHVCFVLHSFFSSIFFPLLYSFCSLSYHIPGRYLVYSCLVVRTTGMCFSLVLFPSPFFLSLYIHVHVYGYVPGVVRLQVSRYTTARAVPLPLPTGGILTVVPVYHSSQYRLPY